MVAIFFVKFFSCAPISICVYGLQAESMETLACHSGHRAANCHLDNSDLCQTDEHKAAEQQNSVDTVHQLQPSRQEVKVPCVADTGKLLLVHVAVFAYQSPSVKYCGVSNV